MNPTQHVSFGGPDPWDKAPAMPAPQPEAETEVTEETMPDTAEPEGTDEAPATPVEATEPEAAPVAAKGSKAK